MTRSSDPILPGGEAGLREALAAVISDTLLNWLVVTPGTTYADNVVDAIVDIIVAEPLAQIQSDRARLEAELASLRAKTAGGAGEWQPIETAPKDGTKVLLLFPPPFRDRLENGITTGTWTHDVWWLSSIWASTVAHKHPTHWKPLDPSPQGEGGGE